jgi:hypothetical protein
LGRETHPACSCRDWRRRSEEQARLKARSTLLSCSRLSSQLFEAASSLRAQRLDASARLATFEALLVYRASAQSAFVLRHTALHDGKEGRLLASSDDGNCVAGSLASFTVVEGLGKGSFGAVFLVEHDMANPPDGSGGGTSGEGKGGADKKTRAVLAMKMVARETVASSDKRVRHLEIERRVMSRAKGHPFIVSLV